MNLFGEKNKKRLMVVSDSPLAPTGVGGQTKYFVDAMLEEGWQVLCLAGAKKHLSYTPMVPDGYTAQEWVIVPVDNYGSEDDIRQALEAFRPDVFWIMTDPRSLQNIFDMEHEIRPYCPIVYYNIWDAPPTPKFNETYYRSCDALVPISKVTAKINEELCPDVKQQQIGHAVDLDVYKPLEDGVKTLRRQQVFGDRKDNFLVFWNNKNQRRKQAGSLIYAFKQFVERTDADATLVMKTNTKSEYGQDLEAICKDLEVNPKTVTFCRDYLTEEQMGELYGLCDLGINISDAEGWGLSVTESLACGLPVIATRTGGMTEQVEHEDKVFGKLLDPVATTLIGSQVVPYIFEDHLSFDQISNALEEMYNLWKDDKEGWKKLTEDCRRTAEERFDLKCYKEKWVKFINEVVEENGSYETRKNHKNYRIARF
jgi:glycosyltransferase involved in cell wall biosynthesis